METARKSQCAPGFREYVEVRRAVRADGKYHRRFSSAVFYYPFNADSAVVGRFGPHLDAPTFLCPSQTCRRIKPDGIARACPRADTGQKRGQAEAGIVTTVLPAVIVTRMGGNSPNFSRGRTP